MLWGRQSASSALQEIFVHSLHKESSHVKMELTVRMDHQYALSVQVDIGEWWICPFKVGSH